MGPRLSSRAPLARGGTVLDRRYLIVVSEADAVAVEIARHWGTPPSTGEFVGGTPLRSLSDAVLLLRRRPLHVEDSELGAQLGSVVPDLPIVFPSRHRSESRIACVTVHALGNLGEVAELGGEPRRVVPAAPRLMADALREFHGVAATVGLPASYEATHHGPLLHQPAFFAEIAESVPPGPRATLSRAVAEVLADLDEDPADRVAIGVGGGHYAPHFTELALGRRWAFGHIASRHAGETVNAEVVERLRAATPGSDGALFQRVSDADDPVWAGLGPRLRDADAPRRPTGSA